MPRNLALSAIVDRCKKLCAMENGGTVSSDDSDAEWKTLVSLVYEELHAAVVESGLRYFETSTTYTTDGTNAYPEPSDHLSTIDVVEVLSGGGERPLRELMAQEQARYTGQTGDAHFYVLRDNELLLFPTPPSGKTYKLRYVPHAPDLSAAADATEVDLVCPSGLAFLLWGVKVLAQDKEETDPTVAIREREAARERIAFWATQRALLQTRRLIVQDDGDMLPDGVPLYPGDWRWHR